MYQVQFRKGTLNRYAHSVQRTNFGEMACSIARTTNVVGEPWSPLILRDVWVGMTRFEQIQADLGSRGRS